MGKGDKKTLKGKIFNKSYGNKRPRKRVKKRITMSKIGRNDPCPCGSGKKYKKCCERSGFSKPSTKKISKDINPFFEKYNSLDLLQSIAGLFIIPENHGKVVRLELFAQMIIKNYQNKTEIITPTTLKSFLDKEYPESHLEDPPINLFTDLITFYGGDYLIFPGITENGSFILSNLLNAIFHWPNSNIPEKFRSNCRQVALLILSISNIIASKLRYARYQDGKASETKIYIPNDEIFNNLKDAVVFSNDEMNQIFKEKSIAKEAINFFLFDKESSDFNTRYVEESPLLYKLILHIEDKYLIVSPTTLCLALTNFIWSEAENWGCMKEVNMAFQNVLWNNLQVYLRQMKFNWIDIDEIFEETEIPIKEGLYQFDEDKIAYIQFIYDGGENYCKDNKNGKINNDKYKEETITKILELPNFSSFQLLHFIIISSIGRNLFYPIKKIKDTRTISIPVFELDVLCNLNWADAIDLWKFATAKQDQLLKIPMLNFSFLDQFKVYKNHNDSFYLSDETKYSFLQIQPGYAADKIREAKLKLDLHSVLIKIDDRNSNIPVVRKDIYAPIYLSPSDISAGELRFVIEGFWQPIWVKPKLLPAGISGELRHMFWELTDTIAYWLWQIQDDIKIDLKCLGSDPVTISFELNPLEKFETIERSFIRNEGLTDLFQTNASQDSMNIIIPSEINSYFYGSDNEGERVLVEHLLLGINKILSINNQPQIIVDKIKQVIETRVPLGFKKKFLIIDTNDNLLLDPRNLIKRRYVQDYNVELILDSIVPGLGKNCPPIGELETKDEKQKLIKNIVIKVLLPTLKKIISQYDSQKLLEYLIGLNETLIRKREFLKIHIPTRIACFVTVEQQEKDLKDSLEKLNRTKIVTRCLIEHIAAEQSKGSKIISTTAIDELIALMDQIISWGSLGDHISYDLFDVKIGVLKSGRVGTEKSTINEVFGSYNDAKINEDVTDSIKAFEKVFPKRNPQKGKDTPDNIDKAFHEDFGISFDRICEFIEGLTIIGIQQDTSFAVLQKNALKIEINKSVDPYGDLEFENAINYLTLFKRGTVEDVPTGFDHYDISPWRFNRRLSLLRRPLVALLNQEDEENPFIYWGFRQVLASRIYLFDQIISNRLKVSDTGKLIKVLGKIAQEQGDLLVKKVYRKLNQKDFIVDTEVPIGPKHLLFDEKDLGDIDVLVIDPKNRYVFSLECKSMAPSRNIKEMVEEISKLFGSNSEKGWIEKHVGRDRWIKVNLQLLGKKYNIDLSGFIVKSFFITEEGMLTPHLKKQSLPIPFVTRYDIENKGLDALLN